MSAVLQARRVGIRLAYAGLRVYWFLVRPRIDGVKCVVIHHDQVLLVRHTYGNRDWDLPGGSVKRRELPRHAARREMHEELGRDIESWTSLGELFVNGDHHDDNLHLFQGHLPDRSVDLDLTELAQGEWFSPDALPPDLARYVRPILARVRKA